MHVSSTRAQVSIQSIHMNVLNYSSNSRVQPGSKSGPGSRHARRIHIGSERGPISRTLAPTRTSSIQTTHRLLCRAGDTSNSNGGKDENDNRPQVRDFLAIRRRDAICRVSFSRFPPFFQCASLSVPLSHTFSLRIISPSNSRRMGATPPPAERGRCSSRPILFSSRTLHSSGAFLHNSHTRPLTITFSTFSSSLAQVLHDSSRSLTTLAPHGDNRPSGSPLLSLLLPPPDSQAPHRDAVRDRASQHVHLRVRSSREQ